MLTNVNESSKYILFLDQAVEYIATHRTEIFLEKLTEDNLFEVERIYRTFLKDFCNIACDEYSRDEIEKLVESGKSIYFFGFSAEDGTNCYTNLEDEYNRDVIREAIIKDFIWTADAVDGYQIEQGE